MKFDFNKSTLIKLGLVLVLLIVAPFFVPFALEFIILADLMGLEALIVFLVAFGKSVLDSIRARLDALYDHMAQTAELIAEIYMFKPRVFLGHATASSLIIVCASSVVLACAVWLPVMFASAQFMGPYI